MSELAWLRQFGFGIMGRTKLVAERHTHHGRMGKLPWDNDGAADWFAVLFEKTKLARQVEGTLRLPVEDSHEEIRAAASVLLFLGRNYIWPVNDLDRHLTLAADRLEEVTRYEFGMKLFCKVGSNGANPYFAECTVNAEVCYKPSP